LPAPEQIACVLDHVQSMLEHNVELSLPSLVGLLCELSDLRHTNNIHGAPEGCAMSLLDLGE
jgi:hypothetical protein